MLCAGKYGKCKSISIMYSNISKNKSLLWEGQNKKDGSKILEPFQKNFKSETRTIQMKLNIAMVLCIPSGRVEDVDKIVGFQWG